MTQGQHLGFRLFLSKIPYHGTEELLYDLLIQKAMEFSRTLEFHTDMLATNKQNQGL
jgi:hypothetical protein